MWCSLNSWCPPCPAEPAVPAAHFALVCYLLWAGSVELMSDVAEFLVASLVWLATFLRDNTPVPWPLMFLVILPILMSVLGVLVWVRRGAAHLINCDYPHTTSGKRCRNKVPGEWVRCHHHRSSRVRLTDGHSILPGIYRWQKIGADNLPVRDPLRVGHGVFRPRAAEQTLLYEQGYAKPPLVVLRSVGPWVRRARSLFSTRWTQVKSSLGGRLTPPGESPTVVQGEVSASLPIVMGATRLSLVTICLGLLLVASTVVSTGGWATGLEYSATASFLLTGAVVQHGVWRAVTGWWWRSILQVLAWVVVSLLTVGLTYFITTLL